MLCQTQSSLLTYLLQVLRDQLDTSTLFLIGALFQLAWTFSFQYYPRIAFLPTIFFAFVKAATFLQSIIAWKRGTYAPEVVHGYVTPVIPNLSGEDRSDITVIILSARANSPLGIFTPGFKQIGSRFQKLGVELSKNREEFDYLGGTSWIGATAGPGKGGSGSDVMTIHYFRSPEGLYKFAQTGMHREFWNWYNAKAIDMPDVSITHEFFTVPANNWEAIYANAAPVGLGATGFKDVDGVYRSPLVDITGQKTSSIKRRHMVREIENEKY
jgi:hypothetical protein